MTEKVLQLDVLREVFAVCRLGAAEAIPEWSVGGPFSSVTRTSHELSIVCLQQNVPMGVKSEGNWRCFKVRGPLDFALTGIMASLTTVLAMNGVSVFVLSTFDTDYLLVRDHMLEKAFTALTAAGHKIHRSK
jgi:uncharacterized protein